MLEKTQRLQRLGSAGLTGSAGAGGGCNSGSGDLTLSQATQVVANKKTLPSLTKICLNLIFIRTTPMMADQGF